MTFETSDVVASVLKSIEPDRSLVASQRVAGAVQDQIAAQNATELNKRKVDTSDKMERARLKREEAGRERKKAVPHHTPQPRSDGQDHLIDTVA